MTPPDRLPPDEAVAAARRAVAESPDDPEALEALAETLSDRWSALADAGEFETAAALANTQERVDVRRRLLELAPQDADASRDVADALHDLARELTGWARVDEARDAVDEAIARYRALLPVQANRHELIDDLADALETAAVVARQRRDASGRRRALMEAVALRRGLVSEGAAGEARYWLASALEDLGDLEWEHRRAAEAAAAYRESAGLYASVRDVELSRELLPGCLRALGEILQELGDSEGAKEALRRAADERRALLGNSGTQIHTPRGTERELGIDLDELGDLLDDMGDEHGAAAAYAEAESVFRRLVAESPAEPRERHDLSLSLGRRGKLALRHGDVPRAVVLLGESAGLLRALLADDPAEPVWRPRLANRLHDLAEAREAGGDRDGAFDAYEESVELYRSARGIVEVDDDEFREALHDAADAAAALGRVDRAFALRAEASALGRADDPR